MASAEDRDNREGTAPSSPSSSTHHSGLKATKDRKCPFCGQAFTSSSLGRHLDLYIKSRNPKPADGVHDVNEILKMRGGITRRQPKSNTKSGSVTRDTSGPASAHRNSNGGGRLADERERFGEQSPVASPSHSRDEQGSRVGMNASNWHVTGIIENLQPPAQLRKSNTTPSTGQAQRVQDMRRDATSGMRVQRPDVQLDNTWKLHEQAETGRAAEMALREVLSSVRAARNNIVPEPMYPDFDFFALPFPGLVLAILPPPPTLHSPAPFASADSWTLTAPGKREFEVLNRLLMKRSRDLRQQHADNPSDSAIFLHNSHVQGAYSNWRLMSDSDKSQAWTMQVLRAFSTTREQLSTTKLELDFARQRVAHLEAEYERLSRCQLPREALSRPPTTLPIPISIARELSTANIVAAGADYDADTLLTRWREVVRSIQRPRQTQTNNDSPTYVDSILKQTEAKNDHAGHMIINGAVFGIGGPMPRNAQMTQEFDARHSPAYTTPSQAGAVLGAVDENLEREDADADAEVERHDDVDISNVLDLSLTGGDQSALERQRRLTRSAGAGSAWQPPPRSEDEGSVGSRAPTGSGWAERETNGYGKRSLGGQHHSSGKGEKVARLYG